MRFPNFPKFSGELPHEPPLENYFCAASSLFIMLRCLIFDNTFLANVSVLDSLKTPETETFSDAFKMSKTGTSARMELIKNEQRDLLFLHFISTFYLLASEV